MTRLAYLFSAVLALALGSHAASADPDSGLRRMKREAAEVFKALANDSDNDLLAEAKTCEFSLNWLDSPVDADIVRRHLNIKLSLPGARLAPPNSADLPDYAESIDPERRHKDSFCSESQAADYYMKQWLATENNDPAAPETPKPALLVTPAGYSFPLFNADFDRALLVAYRATRSLTVDERANVAPSVSGFVAVVFAKSKGKWRVDAAEPLDVVRVAQVPTPPRRPAGPKPTIATQAMALPTAP